MVRAGTWKHTDLPPPVGNKARVSFPSRTEFIISACNVLKEEYRDDLAFEEAIKLAVKCLVKSLQARGEQIRIRIAVVPSDTKRLMQLGDEEVDKYVKEVLGSGT